MATTEFQITATGRDKSIYASGSNWTTVRNTSSGTMRDGLYTQSTLSGATRFIERTFLTFDTSSLPNDATIVSAKLSVYGVAADSAKTNSPSYRIYNSSHSDTIVAADYSAMGTTELSDTYVDSLNNGDWNDFELNSDGIEAISKTGTTKFCIREAVYDVGNTQPGGSNVIRVNDYSSSTTNASKLIVTIEGANNGFALWLA
jgi:hypothetical protein